MSVKNNITKKEICTVLTQDQYYRHLNVWPLLTCNKGISAESYKDKNIYEVFNIPALEKYEEDINEPCTHIKNNHPFIDDLLKEFTGVVAAGGAVTNALMLNLNWSPNDIDLFFYDMTIEEAHDKRNAIIKFLVTKFKSATRIQGYRVKNITYNILRNEYATTIYITTIQRKRDNFAGINTVYDDHVRYIYQIVHRIYPNQSSIIGGFDIGVSMALYDGYDFKCTPLGYWSLSNKILVIDTKRRSTSFENRIRKYYNRGFTVVFPGLDPNIYQTEVLDKVRAQFKYLSDSQYERYMDCTDRDYYGKIKYWEYQQEANLLPYLYINTNNEINKIKVKNFSIKKQTYIEIKRISDYYHDTMDYPYNIGHVNATRMRLGDLNAVVSIINGEKIHDLDQALQTDLERPDIGFNDKVIERYNFNLKYFNDNRGIYGTIHRLKANNNSNLERTVVKYFGSDAAQVAANNYVFNTELQQAMIAKMLKNKDMCIANLKKVKWITTNVGRQWTSSINPICEDPRQWYGKHYISVITGIPPETILRCIYKASTKNNLSTLPLDIFNLLLLTLMQTYANDAWSYIKYNG